MAYLRDEDGVRAHGRASAPYAYRPRPAPNRPLPSDSASEIDCVRHRLAPSISAAAERRAAALGVGADEVLIASNLFPEERFYRALAHSLGMGFAELDSTPRHLCPLAGDSLLQATQVGMLPFIVEGALCWVVAPRGIGARKFGRLIDADPTQRRRLFVTSPEHIRRFVQRHGAKDLGDAAADKLRTTAPSLSAATPAKALFAILFLLAAAMTAGLVLYPAPVAYGLQAAVSLLFLGWAALRIVALLAQTRAKDRIAGPPQPDRALPTYTIVVALYEEAAALPGLIAALRQLDYPIEKLQIILALEADDPKTRLAVEMMTLGPAFEIVLAPTSGPRTKPKALNAALPFARGEFLVVYDAEDRPERDQLRRAAEALLVDGAGRLACVQARLTIDNTSDGVLSALFTAEYAALFDVLLPGLAKLGLPLPLGGSSNHFRTSVLRRAGGWDAYNVTEDADLGTRLARLGYTVGIVPSTTYEEAPAELAAWLRQRTRWFKGWMQTWCVHMRAPRRLLRDLGLGGFLAFQLMLIGTVFAALVQPFAVLLAAASLTGVALIAPPDGLPDLTWLHVAALGVGYGMSVVLGFVGLARRRLLWVARVLPFMLLHWGLLSVAAWRAAYQFVRAPYKWEKTAHGLARTSRRGRGS